MSGYQSLRSSAAWFDLSDRGKIRMTGEDRMRLLQAMTTNNVSALEAGQGCYTFFLNAQGRILGDANVYNLGDSLLLDTERETGRKLFEHLDKYIIADDVTLTDETSVLAAIAIEGPSAEDAIKTIGAPVPDQPWATSQWERGFVAAVSVTGALGFRIVLPADSKVDLLARLQAAGLTEADQMAIFTVRLEHGKPRYGDDITERYLAQETNQMHAISFAKGCYLGQEIVERVRSRAQIHRVLQSIRIRSESAPQPGTKLTLDGKDAGEITSAAFSPAFAEVVGLAYVRVEHVRAKPELQVAGTDPAVTAYLP
jgi:folate-binding protein YgfZ